jgi:Methylase involved in ubiquinone/menaquinone biosynthesis
LVSKDKKAYEYLSHSIEGFPKYNVFCKELERAGFVNVEYKPYTFGVAVLYIGVKSEEQK